MALFYGDDNQGDFLPYLAFNAKSDKWSLNVNKERVSIKGGPTFVADLENIKTGWFNFQEGMAPSVVLDKSLTEHAERPSAKHKRGAKVVVFMKGDHPGAYEFSTNSKNVMQALSALHDQYEAGKAANSGKLPVVEVGDSVEVKSSFKNQDGTPGTATNYSPTFSIVKWVDRPAELTEETAAAPVAVAAPVAAAPAPAPLKVAGGSEF